MSAPFNEVNESNILSKRPKIALIEKDEELREAAATGNDLRVQELLKWSGCGLSINGQHALNGWTALHWASKRNHSSVVQLLLANGADASLQTKKGETAVQLAREDTVILLLGGTPNGNATASQSQSLPIVPHYLSCPEFPYRTQSDAQPSVQSAGHLSSNGGRVQSHPTNQQSYPTNQQSYPIFYTPSVLPSQDTNSSDELVLKVRVAGDQDFIEIDVPRGSRETRSLLTFEFLVSTMCTELGVERKRVVKVRKLPDTIIRRDRDMQRLVNFQELELVVDSLSLGANAATLL